MFSKSLHHGWALRGCLAAAATSPLAPTSHKELRNQEAPRPWTQNYKWFSNPMSKTGLRAPRWPGPNGWHGEPSFTRDQVARNDGSGPDGKIWVTYRDGVYDVTEYLHEHPGGKFILSAAGGPVDSWWSYWMQHQISPKVEEALSRLRIGSLSDWIPEVDDEQSGGGRWEEEQSLTSRAENRERAKRLSELPYQSVTKSSVLDESYLTAGSALFVRNHAPVPNVSVDDAKEHTLTFCIDDDEVASISLDELQERFKKMTVNAVLQCTGNRASDNIHQNGFEHSGLSGADSEFIGIGMLGNVSWSGPKLSEVLRELLPADVMCKPRDDLHVTFEGLDGYYSSTPLSHVMNNDKDCLLVTHMNGEALLPDHGFPLRVALPGCPGARQVKWLSKISVGYQSDSPWVQYFYRDKPSLAPIHSLPMNSVILHPEPGTLLSTSAVSLSVRGVAYSGGTDSAIARVEISRDRGQSWQPAHCRHDEVPADDSSKPRGWLRFEATVQLPDATEEHNSSEPLVEIWCRAVDDAGAVQPHRSAPHGGYLYNGYHKVAVVRSPLVTRTSG